MITAPDCDSPTCGVRCILAWVPGKDVDHGIPDERVRFDSVGTWMRPRATTLEDLDESCDGVMWRGCPLDLPKNAGCFF